MAEPRRKSVGNLDDNPTRAEAPPRPCRRLKFENAVKPELGEVGKSRREETEEKSKITDDQRLHSERNFTVRDNAHLERSSVKRLSVRTDEFTRNERTISADVIRVKAAQDGIMEIKLFYNRHRRDNRHHKR